MNECSIVAECSFRKKYFDYSDIMYNDLFNIKYHWCRFEFAESRGYIHSHLMTITKDSTDRDIINVKFHEPLLSPLYDLMMKMALLGTLCGDLELFERFCQMRTPQFKRSNCAKCLLMTFAVLLLMAP